MFTNITTDWKKIIENTFAMTIVIKDVNGKRI